MSAKKKTVEVWNCEDHGEIELVDRPADQQKAWCPNCGKEMKKTGSYDE
jgi:tRNA(Ile2) C34 agmatinyltransferase TiaS